MLPVTVLVFQKSSKWVNVRCTVLFDGKKRVTSSSWDGGTVSRLQRRNAS